MADANLYSKLDEILAATNRNGERINSLELVLAQCVTAINGLRANMSPLAEAITKLAEAAGKEDKGGDKLALTLKGILDELGKQTGHMAHLGHGLETLTERLPGIMEDTALNAVQLATGGGAGPVPKAEG